MAPDGLPSACPGGRLSNSEDLRISVLGPVTVHETRSGTEIRLTRKEASFLAYLAISGEPQTRERLAELFWPDRPQGQGLGNLRVMLSRLRGKLGDALDAGRISISLAATVVRVDVAQLAAALDEPSRGDGLDSLLPQGRVELAVGASGEVSPEYDAWLETRRTALEQQVVAARRHLLDAALARDDFKAALEQTRHLIATVPFDESAHRWHMEMLAMSGQRAAALRHYEGLADRLGTEPEYATRMLAESLAKARGPADDVATRARRLLLERVERFWIDQVFLPAVPSDGPLDIEERTRPDLIANRWRHVDPDPSPDRTFGPAVPGSLLILGDAGAGKTFRLLQIARDAIEAARDDSDAPLPVVLHLGSWTEATALNAWVASELNTRYHIPRQVASAWIEQGSLLLLLDGLDELESGSRRPCVAAINDFLVKSGLATIVLCCRLAACTQLASSGIRLDLDAAIELRPLTATQTEGVLGEWWDDEELRTAVRNPLILSLVVEQLAAERAGRAADEPIADRVVSRYVDRVLSRCAGQRERFAAWGRELATGMLAHGDAVFQIESLQPTWVRSERARLAYRIASRAFAGMLLGLVGAAFLLIADPSPALQAHAVVAGLVAGAVVGLIDRGSGPQWTRMIPAATAAGLVFVALMPLFGIDIYPPPAIGFGLLLAWLLTGPAPGEGGNDIRHREALRWSARAATRWLAPVAATGYALGIVGGVLAPDEHSLATLAAAAIPFALGTAAFAAVVTGLQVDVADGRLRPNYGTWISLRTAAVGAGWVAAGLLVATAVAQVLGVWIDSSVVFGEIELGLDLGSALAALVLFSGIAFLWYGGIEVAKHLTLRVALWSTRTLPLRLGRFLEQASECGLLRFDPLGASFRHRLVMEHLAATRDGRID